MKSARFELFYSPLCPTCPAAKEIVRAIAEEKEVSLEEINVMSPEGEKRAGEYGIKGIPYLIVDGVHHISGIPTKGAILKFIRGKDNG
jgi:small redox-active disulfide protein 1